MNLSRVGPGEEPGGDVELAEELTHHLIGIPGCAQSVQFRHHTEQRTLHVFDGTLRVELTLLVQRTLTAYEFFAVKVGQTMEYVLVGLTGRCGEA